jgi:hypothetical protein
LAGTIRNISAASICFRAAAAPAGSAAETRHRLAGLGNDHLSARRYLIDNRERFILAS